MSTSLAARLAVVRGYLAAHAGRADPGSVDADPVDADPVHADPVHADPVDGYGLAAVVRALRLSPFERDVLVLAAGCELDARIPALCAAAQPDPARAYATFGLALAALPGAHWSALTPQAPLRGFALVDVDPRGGLTAARLRVEERVLHLLVGLDGADERLATVADPVDAADVPLAPGHAAVLSAALGVWQRSAGRAPVVLRGADDARHGVEQSLGYALGAVRAWRLPAGRWPVDPDDAGDLVRRLARESWLANSPMLLDLDDAEPAIVHRALRWAARLGDIGRHLVLSCREVPPQLPASAVTLDLPAPTYAERVVLWRDALGARAAELNGQVERMAGHFLLGGAGVAASVAEAELLDGAPSGGSLWRACRVRARADLAGLADRVQPRARWTDLVLSDRERATLHDIMRHARHRAVVYEGWAAAGPGARGAGVTALFAGPSGTGKSLAAEVIAGELDVDLYRVDLSQVVSKYIGETEKNLRRVFAAAERGGAVLVFDEADALFGKRSEVKDSHDRYANIEVSYLLQRMEAYQGLAVLTTNLRSAIDQAFVRRLGFIVTFPFPDAAQREQLWRRAFGPGVPVGKLRPDRLAQLNLAGGNIRNVAVHAAFLAAERGGEVTMADLLRGARVEYDKLERPLTQTELAGWPT